MAVLKHSPELLRRATPLFNYLRNECSLPWHVRELAMIITARLTDYQYIWNAHVVLGRQSGLNDNLIDSLRDKKPLPQLSPEESAVVNCGTEFFTTRRVSQETFDSVLAVFGRQGLVELTSLMGFDGIWMDLEHHAYSVETAENLIRAARVGGADILARPAKGEFMRIGRLLEAGAHGILYPRCDGVEEAQQVIRWTKFAPLGERGFCGGNADMPYCTMPIDEYVRQAGWPGEPSRSPADRDR